nr:Hsp20/alpha crystallin family protein [uncultured Duganella sp.]
MANSLIRFDPIRDIARFDPFRNIDDFMRDFAGAPAWRGEPPAHIRMDVGETDKHYEVSADMPGLQKSDIKVAIDGNVVSLSVEYKQEKTAGDVNSLCQERARGQLQRSFTLPQDVDEAAAQARYENGVLHLTLPKKAGGTQHKLTVQ